MEKCIAVFDIGKTNKKFFLFNTAFEVCFETQTTIPQDTDEDNHPCESIGKLKTWMQECFQTALANKQFNIEALNFSAYGASFVHLDANGVPITPLYNYTKPFPDELRQSFFERYGPELPFSANTGSFEAGMLNSGMQLYWLKHQHPITFKAVQYSLHLPQYLSYLFAKRELSDYTSVGCHTALWDFNKKKYHHWVEHEGIASKLAPLTTSPIASTVHFENTKIKIGVGIHDSSAALLPYLKTIAEPFLLLSTGTWNVVLNPFSEGNLQPEEVAKGCLFYMQPNGEPVKASRLYLGFEYEQQVKALSQQFGVELDRHKNISFNPKVYQSLKNKKAAFQWVGLTQNSSSLSDKLLYSSFEEAYHHLLMALVDFQIEALHSAKGNTPIHQLFVEGGFSKNEIFIKLLCLSLPDMEIFSSEVAQGSALGAALVMSDCSLTEDFLQTHYKLTKHSPPALSS